MSPTGSMQLAVKSERYMYRFPHEYANNLTQTTCDKLDEQKYKVISPYQLVWLQADAEAALLFALAFHTAPKKINTPQKIRHINVSAKH